MENSIPKAQEASKTELKKRNYKQVADEVLHELFRNEKI
jgi:hypothetical protein